MIVYRNKNCSVCEKEFTPVTSTHKGGSEECRRVLRRRSKLKAQVKYHAARKTDPQYTIAKKCRNTLNKLITRGSIRLSSARIFPFTKSELTRHFELRFKPGMTWANAGEWHVDHIRPLSSFRLANPDGTEDLQEIRRANDLKNLQPLWAKENLSKHDTWGTRLDGDK